MKHLKQLFVFALISLFSVSMWADTPAAAGTTLFSEDFSSYSANNVPDGSVTTATGRVVYGGANVTYTCTDGESGSATKVVAEALATGTSPEIFIGKYGSGGSTGGSFSITGIPSGGAQEITVSFKQNKQKLKVAVAGTGYTSDGVDAKPAAAGSVSFDITVADGAAATFDLTFSVYSSNVRVDDILVTVKTAGEGAGTPTCATPTFSPAAGAVSSGTTVEITSATGGATIYYTMGADPADPTTSSTEYTDPIEITSATTIKAIAVKTDYNNSAVASADYTVIAGVSGYNIDFESDLVSYVDWEFTNLTKDNSITAHGGSNFAKTNGTNTAAATTKAKIAAPGTVTYYVSKIGTNTNANSYWYVEVSSDGSEWTKVGGDNAAAVGITQGTWTEYSADLSEYTNVYVRVYYKGTTAVRAIDDISIEMASAVAKPTISGDENFVTSTTVTLACSTTGAEIYYTTDGSDPKTSGSIGTSFSLTETKTVRAIAKLGSDWSAEATPKTFTKVTPMTTAAELRSFATSSAQDAFIQLDGWKVTFVNGNNAYMIDPSNEGVILNNASHGYVAGDELNDEVVEASVKLASGRVQLSGFTSTDITATSGTVSPVDITDFSTVLAANQSRLITLKNATYASSTGTFSDGEHLIYFYDQFSANPALVDGATYDVTGVVIYYKNNTTDKVQVAPRTAADVVPTSVIVIPTAANLAALKAAARGTYILTLTNAVVTYVNGNNAFIEDATGGALIYLASHGFTAGDCLNGDYQVVTTDHQGKFEITAIEPQAGAATTTAAIPLTTVSIATLNADFASYESRRIKIVGANVTDAISGSDRNGTINDGAELAVYAAVASTITLTANDNVDIIGYPGFHNTDQQLTVWQQSDITVNEKDPAGIAFTPESETITGGDPWSAPAFANPNSLDVDFGTSNDAVATVSNTGVVSLVGGYGTAIITAHTDGDATHASATVTYTITVNDPGATPVYTMSFDLSRASYDNAADEEVVWNSNVVTITAQKNTGTKVTNYLAGNYSGTTLIAETRFYTKNSLSFVPQAGVTITKVEWMSTAKGYATKLAAETWTNATVEVDATDDKLVNIIPSAAGEFSVTLTDAARATGITVYYTAESEKAKLTASISIDDMNMAVGDDDILLSAIAATSNPNKKAISYEVTSGTAVTIEGTGAEAALHAAAEGSATITATIPDDLGNYTGATTSFTVTVSAAATLESIAISGTATELEYTEGQSFNPAGLTVMGHYSNGSDEEITSGIDWTFAPDPLTEGTTSVSVTATVETISSDAIVVNGLTVSGPAPVGDNYVKVTASQTDWSGDYILVYEDGTDAYVWNGDYSDGANNYASATISSNTIAKPAAAAVITIAAASEGKYTLQVNGDKYFQDNGSNSKLIFTDAIADAAEVTISYETDWTQLLFSERCIRFNSNSGQTRFRFYAASSQQAVQLYKKEAPTPNYTRTVTVGKIGTLCVPNNVEAGNAQGAVFYQIAGKASGKLEFVEVDALEAGKPYIFQATEDAINLYYGATSVANPVEYKGMVGSFSDKHVEITESNKTNIMYIASNKLWDCSDLTPTPGYLDVLANRAYIFDYENIGAAPAHAPGKRYIVVGKDQATGFDQLDASETPMKLIIDGQLFILRGEKMYNANGQLVK